MAQKTVWLTWMAIGEGAPSPQPSVEALSKSGFAVTGAPWVDAPADFAWTELAERLVDDGGPDVWVVAARRQDLANANHRFGLCMVAAMVRADRKKLPHLAIVGLDGMPQPTDLPTLLRSCKLVDGSAASWPAKVLTATISPASAPDEPFRLRVSAMKHIGLWIEVGPKHGEWSGAMVGVAGEAKITNHAVGPQGGLPERTVLEYKLEGLELEIGSDQFTAWAVQNHLGAGDSYYVKIDGTPGKVLIGQHPDGDPEVSVLTF
ncbi:MAG TPA: hypothetical protein VFZ65_03240 [Planctomycetota bacterium]|nr:hypothetical protein [Planctomycetota bacterium]